MRVQWTSGWDGVAHATKGLSRIALCGVATPPPRFTRGDPLCPICKREVERATKA